MAESVWQFVPMAEVVARELQGPPSWSEFDSALRAMKFGRRGGMDDVCVELVRFGGATLHVTVFNIVLDMWLSAGEAAAGNEAADWSEQVTTGICIPMFKNKGDRGDKANYRNLVMLSVAAKFVAKIAATRLSRWASNFLSEEQNGFRPGRGIDDIHQLTRRVLEEMSVAASEGSHVARIGLTRFDIVRAYTRVCRIALWEVLLRMGVPEDFLAVLKALHDHTRFMVFAHNGYSDAWFTERGLREGCPSSPILFSIFHHCVLLTFRARRLVRARELGCAPGLAWAYKVDGRIARPGKAKRSSRGVVQVVLGEYADDTALLGHLNELKFAEHIFTQTLADWEQSEHVGKREKLVVAAGGRAGMEVLHQYERRLLKHLGATLSDNAAQWAETNRRVQAGFFAVKRVAKLWSLGTHRGRGSGRGLSITRKLKIVRAVLEGTLLACGKSRVWNLAQERKANQVLSRGVRRCLGLDIFNMSERRYNDEALRKMVCWDSFSNLIHRQVLKWVGHVARMPASRAPKVALFGWPLGLEAHRSARYTFPQWVAWLFQKYGISELDWFRLAQKPTGNWLKIIDQVLPRARPARSYQARLNSWKVGDAAILPPTLASEERSSVAAPTLPLQCPACSHVAKTARELQVHYDGQHAVFDEFLLTVSTRRCPLCSQVFVYSSDAKTHQCPSKIHTLDDLSKAGSATRSWTRPHFDMENLTGWVLYVDGSGCHDSIVSAGWGVAIWSLNSDNWAPECELFGPEVLG